ncbi:SMC-Scp complex subunit ScpB [Microbulbifer variabilis]|uniref:SMC-Scp complex subunit ScpB n=1 Tax=Microbulbifer variabilis TaxID=266805 RepID=A0ABY4V7Z9_9GAMM|nr:SMC-Scp complex subunit ScpB [Microbulbifer variabilis]USD20383.1 SMC-Scp complex subunit ScpB [Microbulbifer variabilis]
MTIAPELLRRILEGALLASAQPLSEEKLLSLLDEEERPSATTLRDVLGEIAESCAGRGFELKKVASGWRFQVPEDLAPWVNRLWEEKAQRYSRATLETLAIIAYRQPVTRGDIEEIRGVAVSSQIVRTLLDRGWIKVVGHRDVPGKPSLYATTRDFLDYFNLSSLDDLPTLAEIRDIESLNKILESEGLPPEEIAAALAAEGEELSEGEQASVETEEEAGALESEEQEESEDAETDTDAEEDARVAAALEEIAAEANIQLETDAEQPEIETEAAESDDVAVAELSTEAQEEIGGAAPEDEWELAQTQSESPEASEPLSVDAEEESTPEKEHESEIEQDDDVREPQAPIAATLPKSSLFGDIDTEAAIDQEEPGSSDVDEDSQEVVQAENTTP